LADREILKSVIRIDITDRGQKSLSRSASPASLGLRQTRSRLQSSSEFRSRSASPVGLASPTLCRKTSRLNIVSIPVPDQVRDITVATVDREHKLVSDNDMIACQLE
jgi:hypothetical protein